MVCIYCGEKTRTVNSRSKIKISRTWRRRECSSCKAVFTTAETPDLESSIRVSKNSALKPFLYEKLFLDVYSSLSHRKNAYTDAQRLSDTIIAKLIPCNTGVLGVNEIITATQEVLKRFDKAAATYYRAHHGHDV